MKSRDQDGRRDRRGHGVRLDEQPVPEHRRRAARAQRHQAPPQEERAQPTEATDGLLEPKERGLDHADHAPQKAGPHRVLDERQRDPPERGLLRVEDVAQPREHGTQEAVAKVRARRQVDVKLQDLDGPRRKFLEKADVRIDRAKRRPDVRVVDAGFLGNGRVRVAPRRRDRGEPHRVRGLVDAIEDQALDVGRQHIFHRRRS